VARWIIVCARAISCVAAGVDSRLRSRWSTEQRVGLHEVSREEEGAGHVLVPEDREDGVCGIGVASTVERERDDVLPGP
jgi:hypothetical protein